MVGVEQELCSQALCISHIANLWQGWSKQTSKDRSCHSFWLTTANSDLCFRVHFHTMCVLKCFCYLLTNALHMPWRTTCFAQDSRTLYLIHESGNGTKPPKNASCFSKWILHWKLHLRIDEGLYLYWLNSAWMAAIAASLTSNGAGKSGKPAHKKWTMWLIEWCQRTLGIYEGKEFERDLRQGWWRCSVERARKAAGWVRGQTQRSFWPANPNNRRCSTWPWLQPVRNAGLSRELPCFASGSHFLSLA